MSDPEIEDIKHTYKGVSYSAIWAECPVKHFLLHIAVCQIFNLNWCMWAQVEEAMTIFQDMVARGCERNVITYSSLITACEKSGRYQLALDFFNEMHRDNVKPNVVTYNALIAACGQGGLSVLFNPEIKISIRRISKGGSGTKYVNHSLLKVHERQSMRVYDLAARTQPMPCGILDTLPWPEVFITFLKGLLLECLLAMTLCSFAGGQWETAREIFQGMMPSGCKPDAITYGTLISVLDRGSQWGHALQVILSSELRLMQSLCFCLWQQILLSSARPHQLPVGGKVGFFGKLRSRNAVQAFEDMQSQGHRPDVGVYNTLIEVLSRSGSCPANLKAIQLFLAASRQGQFRCISPQVQHPCGAVCQYLQLW